MDNKATTKGCFSHSEKIVNPLQWQPFRLTASAVPIWERKTPCFMAHAQAVETIGRTLIIEYLDQHSHVSDVAGLEIFHASRSCAFWYMSATRTERTRVARCVRRCTAAGKIKIYPAQPGKWGNFYVEKKT